jgi:O-antigen ligase
MENHTTRPQTIFSVMDRERLWKWHEYLGKGCLMGLMALLPFAHLRLVLSILLGGLVVSIVIRWWLEGKVYLPYTPINLPLFLFSGWVILSLVTATKFTYSLFQIKNELLTHLLIFFSVIFFIRDRKDIKKLLLFLYLGLFIICVFGVYEFWDRGGSFLDRSVRIGSLTPDYIYLSTYLLLSIPMTLTGIHFFQKKNMRVVILLLFLFSLFCMFLTFTRIAWAVLFIQILFYGVFRNRIILGTGVVSLILVISFSFFSPLVKNAVKTYGELGPNDQVVGIEGRVNVWKFAFSKILEHPVTGIGYGRDIVRFVYSGNQVIDEEYWHTFNTFIDTALEIGIPGVLFLLGVFFFLLKVFWEGMREKDRGTVFISTGLMMVVMGYFLRNQVDHVYVDFPSQLFWLLMGLGMVLVSQPTNVIRKT